MAQRGRRRLQVGEPIGESGNLFIKQNKETLMQKGSRTVHIAAKVAEYTHKDKEGALV